MATPVSDKAAVDVPARVFEKYLQALVEAKASPEVISRLRATLLEDKSFTERALNIQATKLWNITSNSSK
jgi:hypothetical protein